MHRLPVDVTPNLYLGDAGCAADLERLKSLSITHVLNCAAGETRDMSGVYVQHGIQVWPWPRRIMKTARCSTATSTSRPFEEGADIGKSTGALRPGFK